MSRERVAIKDGRNPGWHWAGHEVIDAYGAELGPYGLALYYALCRHANERGESWPSYATLAKKTGMSRKQAREVMKRLVGLELVSKAPRKDDAGDPTSNLYTLLDLNGGREPRTLPKVEDTPRVGNDVPQARVSPTPKEELSNNNRRKEEILLEKRARVLEKDEFGKFIDRSPREKCPECGQYLRECICEKETV